MNRKHLLVPTLASAFAVSLLVQTALAQTASSAPKPATAAAATIKPDVGAEAIMKFSQDGSNALREIASARVAIFNGDPESAVDLIAKAKASVAKAEQEAPTFTVKTTEWLEGKAVDNKTETAEVDEVPVDGQLMLAEDFVPTPQKLAHINKANEHLKNGKSKEALEELRLGDIAVIYSRAWMPLASTYKRIEQANNLMNDHKYYEANLALKAIGDSLTVDSVILTGAPKQKS